MIEVSANGRTALLTVPAAAWVPSRRELGVTVAAGHFVLDLFSQCAIMPDTVQIQPEVVQVKIHAALKYRVVPYNLLNKALPQVTLPGGDLIRLCSMQAPPEPPGLTEFKQIISDVKIEGRFPPMPHQYKAAWFKSQTHRAFDLSTMRTGKTGSTMLALEWLFRKQQIKKVLILAPLSCVRPVWVEALQTTLPQRLADAAVGTKARKLAVLSGLAEIIVTNYETVSLCYNELLVFRPDAVVIDECTHYANRSTARSKAIKNLIAAVTPAYVWGLTGTPGHDPIKAFAMSKLITPAAVSVQTLSAWRDMTQYKYGPQAWQWKNKDCAPQLIRTALSPAVLFKKDDLFDLPPVVYSARQVELTAPQRRLCDKLKQDMVAVAESGELITAAQKSVLVSKLLQTAGGAVLSDKGDVIDIDADARAKAILELIHESDHKTVIFSAFKGMLHKLADKLKEAGLTVGVVDGDVSETRRAKIFHDFQYALKGDPQGLDVLIAHPRTTAFGVELAAADTMIFDGAPLSGDFVYGQAVERLSSVKQKAKEIQIVQVYAIAEERQIFKSLQQGQILSSAVADLFKSVTGI